MSGSDSWGGLAEVGFELEVEVEDVVALSTETLVLKSGRSML